MNKLVSNFEQKQLRTDLPNIKIGDTLDVHVRIFEGNKERIQIFTGICVAMKGEGLNKTFTVKKNSYGTYIVRIFPLHSPHIKTIVVKGSAKVRKAKLYYLLDENSKHKLKPILKTKKQPSK
ncbi:50S ribosomal protein L19 [Mycoplasma sp. SG1]|nr:50S ribosomal protein L19 [Mycoplasma sp. SG1]